MNVETKPVQSPVASPVDFLETMFRLDLTHLAGLY